MTRIFFSVSILLLLATAFLPIGKEETILNEHDDQNPESKESVQLRLTTSVLDRWHYNPKTINDDFSEKVFDTYLKYIDGSKRFLLASEVEELQKNKTSIDDEILLGNQVFFNQTRDLLLSARKRAKSFSEDILSKPLNIRDLEYLELDGDKRPFASSESELKEYWRKWLEHEVLQRFYTRIKKQEKRIKNEEDFDPVSKDSLLQESQEKVVEVFDKWFKRLDKQEKADHYSTYLNVIANIYDPHTNYYKPKDKESFDISMSGKLEGIGARLRSDGEETSVVSIVPGSPSWKQGDLAVKDVILEVAQGEDTAVDIAGMEIDEVVELIRGKKGTEVRLTVRKLDGSISIIPIIRDVVVLEEGLAKSLIIEHNQLKDKIGYIKLPRFYADFEDRNGNSSARDIKKELLKLNDEGADALIFDLRNNSGGSLRDVVEMVGYFIEEGPVVQVKNKDGSIEILADEDQGEVIWDKPVVVLVNKFSASASEIFAAAMQDYNRALIVGSPNTYGKGTVQRFIDLDRTVRGYDEYKPLGSVKYTIQKYYRINGGSTQLEGVSSDVILPDSWHYTTTGERELDHAMPWTEIPAATFTQNVYDLESIKSEIISRSEARIGADNEFSQIYLDAERLNDEHEKTRRIIQVDSFFDHKRKDEAFSDAFDSLFTEIPDLKPINLHANIEKIQLDSARLERNEKWIESMQEDIYVEEAVFIIADMMDLNGKLSSKE